MNPLDQLADITPPNAVSMWPLAWGYWVALGILVAIVAVCIFAFVQYRNKRKVKREALISLSKVSTADEYYNHKIQVIMKALCSHYLPNTSSAQMHGEQWQSFIMSIYRGKETERLSQVLKHLYQGLYSPDVITEQSVNIRNEDIQLTIKEWIVSSFPCKKASLDQSHSASINTLQIREVTNV